MSKSDGTKIVIQFDDVVSASPGIEDSFIIKVPEYDYVPGGPIIVHDKSVGEVFRPGESFNRRRLEGVRVSYDYISLLGAKLNNLRQKTHIKDIVFLERSE